MITEKQRIERRQGIGGSDIQHLFSIEPYGCQRYLWLDKQGDEPDYPILSEGAIKRGNKMENIIIEEYREVTGNNVRKVHRTLTHKTIKWARVHLDGEIVGDHSYNREPSRNGHPTLGPGVLECKSVGRQMFMKIKQEGIPKSWILQMQHGMFVTNRAWASIAVLWAEQWEFVTFNVDRNEEIVKAIQYEGNKFWAKVENGPSPERLDPKDKRCSRCPYRTSCQGAALLGQVEYNGGDIEFDDTLTPMVQELVELELAAAEIGVRVNDKKTIIKEKIGDRPVVDCTGYRLHFRPIESKRINARRLKSEEPGIYEKYATISVSRPFKKTAK